MREMKVGPPTDEPGLDGSFLGLNPGTVLEVCRDSRGNVIGIRKGGCHEMG